MSLRSSAFLALCQHSGGRYSGEPMSALVLVRLTPAEVVPDSIFEMPKSRTLTAGEPSARRAKNRLAGLRSRCTIPSEWACASASQACSTYRTASAMATRPQAAISSSRSRPSRYSSTMYGAPLSSVPTSRTRATCSLLIFAAIFASR